jgi:hypothetical protein
MERAAVLRFHEQLDIDALPMGDLKSIFVEERAFMVRASNIACASPSPTKSAIPSMLSDNYSFPAATIKTFQWLRSNLSFFSCPFRVAPFGGTESLERSDKDARGTEGGNGLAAAITPVFLSLWPAGRARSLR